MSTAHEPIQPEKEYFAHLSEGRFMIQQSKSTGQYVFYPRVAAPGTGARDLEWVMASGRAVVYATTVMRAKPPTPPYNVCLVALEEGPQMMSRVENVDPSAVTVGMRVQARISKDENGNSLVVFDPATQEQT